MNDKNDKREHDTIPATGSNDDEDTNLLPGEEPYVPGTLFLTLILLMLIFGFWVLAYVMLLER